MVLNTTEFETFEQQFLELIAEFESISISEKHLRDTVGTESTRAEAAEAARDAAERACAEARHGASAATASAAHAVAALAKAQEDLANVQTQVEVTERQRSLLEERCIEMTQQLSSLEREVQQLRPLQAAHGALQRQFGELQERVRAATEHAQRPLTGPCSDSSASCRSGSEPPLNMHRGTTLEHDREERCIKMTQQLSSLEREVQQLRPLQAAHGAMQRQFGELQERVRAATEHAQSEASRLESELRRVERCAGGGAEIRERARLAAAAHARERRRAAAELQHAAGELRAANTEITRLNTLVAELQARLSEISTLEFSKTTVDPDKEALSVAKAALEAERAGSARLERALAAALADNATLAASLHARDNVTLDRHPSSPQPKNENTKISPIDSFLAD